MFFILMFFLVILGQNQVFHRWNRVIEFPISIDVTFLYMFVSLFSYHGYPCSCWFLPHSAQTNMCNKSLARISPLERFTWNSEWKSANLKASSLLQQPQKFFSPRYKWRCACAMPYRWRPTPTAQRRWATPCCMRRFSRCWTSSRRAASGWETSSTSLCG